MGIVYSKPPTQSKVGYSRLIKAVYSWTLNGTKDRNFATSLGKLFDYLTMLTVKISFLSFK